MWTYYSIYLFVHSVHSPPFSLSPFGGCEQGYPLGQLLLCLSFNPFCVENLDDIMLGGSMDEILHDLKVIKTSSD